MSAVETRHTDYSKYRPRWDKCRHFCEGEVKDKAELYLRPLSGHSSPKDERYLGYLDRAYYYNASGRTVDALSGAVFAKTPNVELPTQMEAFVEDVTLSGCSLEELANQLMEEMLQVGRHFILADHNQSAEERGVTVAIAEARNLRPKLVPYRAEQVINWRYGMVNKRWILTLVVLEEQYDNEINEFEVTRETRYRVLRMVNGQYQQEVWERSGEEFAATERHTPTLRNRPFDYIPGFMFGPCNDDEIEMPPLWDLIEANHAHYKTSADYEHGTHFTGLPTYFGSGFKLPEGESFPVGSTEVYVRSEPDANVEIIEFTGKGLETLEKNLERKEQHMASLGARLLQESPRQVETAQAVNTKQSGENSVLASLAKSASKGLTWLLEIARDWQGVSGEISIELNTDYIPDSVDAQTITALIAACQKGLMTRETFVYNMQRGGYLPEETTIEEEVEEAEEQDAPPPGMDEFGQPPQNQPEQPPQAANG